jgi:hypothetical protein
MKRLFIVTAGLVFLVSAASFAQTTAPVAPRQGTTATAAQVQPAPPAMLRGWGPRFVDNDGDGVCDFYGWSGRGLAVSRGRGAGTAGTWGPRFVDRNADGICDYYPGVAGQARYFPGRGVVGGAQGGVAAGAQAVVPLGRGTGARGSGGRGGRRGIR